CKDPFSLSGPSKFDRDDMVTLWKLVKDRFKEELPKSDLEKYLFWPLKVMFGPIATDGLWQFEAPIKSWRLYKSCRVHCLIMEGMIIYMLDDVEYPLPKTTLQKMLDHKCEVSIRSKFGNNRGCKGIGSSGGQMFDMPTTEPVGSQLVASQAVVSQPVSRQTRSRGPVASQPLSSQTVARKQVARKPVQASESSQPASGKRPASQINEPASQASQSSQPASQASRLPTSPMKRTKMTACRLTPDS
ncbi:hypothetical protein Tco_0980816, partial [Tanacetum coccineum]